MGLRGEPNRHRHRNQQGHCGHACQYHPGLHVSSLFVVEKVEGLNGRSALLWLARRCHRKRTNYACSPDHIGLDAGGLDVRGRRNPRGCYQSLLAGWQNSYPESAAGNPPGAYDKGRIMRIKLSSVVVDDQEKALKFYTEVLGFLKKTDIPAGKFKWLTVVSPDGPADIELLLEPNDNPAAKTYQEALFQQGIPLTLFFVEDIQKEYERMKNMGVTFRIPPTPAGPVTIAVFDDTCGNLIRLVQESK
jgi:catechol 2,3-dioxygenase-like lactoylglutathione lyase family enzyme